VGSTLTDVLTGNGSDDSLFGNGGNDSLNGGSGQDSLEGGTGADRMDGGSGDDQYSVDDIGDTITDSSGLDSVVVDLRRFVLTGTGVETVIYTGEGKFTGVGNDLDNTIIGGNLIDILNGGGGADQMVGLNGNDRYVISSDLDVVEEEVGGGVDTVERGNGNITLTAYANVENARLVGTGAFGLFGDKDDNKLTGNSADNVIVGDGGADVLFGDAGADVFRFVSVADSTPTASDRILDFTPDEDRIDLLQIDARPTDTRNNAFVWIGEQAFGGLGVASEGQLRFGFRGALTVVQADVDGDGKADLVILLKGEFNLSDADFIL